MTGRNRPGPASPVTHPASSPPPVTSKSGPSTDTAQRRQTRSWAALIQRVWEVDPLKCAKCGGQMQIISFIEVRRRSSARFLSTVDFGRDHHGSCRSPDRHRFAASDDRRDHANSTSSWIRNTWPNTKARPKSRRRRYRTTERDSGRGLAHVSASNCLRQLKGRGRKMCRCPADSRRNAAVARPTAGSNCPRSWWDSCTPQKVHVVSGTWIASYVK